MKRPGLRGFNHSNRMARQRIDRAGRPALRYTSCLAPWVFRMRNSAKNKYENDEILRPRNGLGCLPIMRDDYLKAALKTIDDPNILVNVVSRRVKQLRRGSRPLVESLEKLTAEDTALREIIEGKISYELAPADALQD